MRQENDHTPQTVKEVGIHLVYLSEDIKELKDAVKNMPAGFASKDDLTALSNRVAVLEAKQNLKNTLTWVGLVTTTLISIIAVYNLITRG